MIEFEGLFKNEVTEISINNICGFRKRFFKKTINGFEEEIIVTYSKIPKSFKYNKDTFNTLVNSGLFIKEYLGGKEIYINKERLLARHVKDEGILLEFPYDIYICIDKTDEK